MAKVEGESNIIPELADAIRQHPELSDATRLSIAQLIGVEQWELDAQYPEPIPFTNLPKTGSGEGLSPHGGGWESIRNRVGGKRKIKPPVRLNTDATS